jgi:hypothetical protein
VTYRHRGLRFEDVFLASYPRSGSTWLQFLLFELLTEQSPEFVEVNESVPYVGSHPGAPSLLPNGGRLIKTHEPPRSAYLKTVYLVRDARDVLLSEYRYQTMRHLYTGDFDQFLRDFLEGEIHTFGSWAAHVDAWLNAAKDEDKKVFVLRYRDLRHHTHKCLKGILNFLEVEVDDPEIQKAIENNSLNQMKAKENQARQTVFSHFEEKLRFVNQGAVGGWNQELSETNQKRIIRAINPTLVRIEKEVPPPF